MYFVVGVLTRVAIKMLVFCFLWVGVPVLFDVAHHIATYALVNANISLLSTS